METKRMNDTVYEIMTYFGNASVIVLLLLAVALYLLPTIIGAIRRRRNLIIIAFFNVFLGWTVIAWAVMLIEVLKSEDAP
jgi:high-affinity K+ transport system ATPase subunit B